MNNLGHKDEWLIQRMVDGELIGKDVMKFKQLIRNSQHARKLYGELLYVHTALQSEAHFIGSVDFSDEIMRKLYG